MGEKSGRSRALAFGRKLVASAVTVAAAGGLVVFAHVGAFDGSNDPFPHSVVTPAG